MTNVISAFFFKVMKKNYLNADLEIVRLEAEDIITTSGKIDVKDGNDIIDLPFVPAD
jgi:hypothetical protein